MSVTTPAAAVATEAGADRIHSRIVWRFIPLLFACYVVAYLDRINVGFAKLRMLGNLGFSEAAFGLGAGIFFIGYFLFEVLSNIQLHKVSGLAAKDSTVLPMPGMVMAIAGIVTALPMFWALPTAYLGGAGAAVGIALINATGNLAGFVSPAILGWLKDYKNSLDSGLFLVSGCLAASAVLVLAFVPAASVNR
ncbi:MAG: hypothetical protein ACRYHQ_26835 [Janthinobacterium lividum]